MENTVKKIINQATKWVGYLEKRNNAQRENGSIFDCFGVAVMAVRYAWI